MRTSVRGCFEPKSDGLMRKKLTQTRSGRKWIEQLRRQMDMRAPRNISGFTLIELLVVLIIMGLFAGLVSAITRPDDRALLRVEAERLAQLMDLAATKSRLTGRSIAWTADGSSYRFWQLSEETDWSEILDDDTLRARTLPEGMVIAGMRVENVRAAERIRLQFDPYGVTPAFHVEMVFGTARCAVTGSPIGELRVVPEIEKG